MKIRNLSYAAVLCAVAISIGSAMTPPTVPIAGNLDVYGGAIILGNGVWTDPTNPPQAYLVSKLSSFRLISTNATTNWTWELGSWDPSTLFTTKVAMKLDSSNRLSLFDPTSASTNATIVLDPGGPQPSILINGQAVLTNPSSYLSVNPSQLTVGVNNSVGADAVAVGSFTQATGHNSAAIGSNTIASGDNSTAIGDHTQAQGFGQFVAGSYNAPQGNPTASGATDQLFVVGNGTDDAHRSNALTLLRNGRVGIGTPSPAAKLDVQGDTNVNGNLKVTGAISIPPQGDLSMGQFTQGSAP
jgi:hypothetical protein